MTLYGPWLERLDAIAASRTSFAVAGWRDVPAGRTAPARIQVAPITLLDGRGKARALDIESATRALAFVTDELLVSGDDAGRLIAWDVGEGEQLAELELGAPVRALALDADAARGASGTIVVATADGALHVVRLAIEDGTPQLTAAARRVLSESALGAVAIDPVGLVVAGAADGRLWIAPIGDLGAARAVAPGGDGGIRALACIADGRVAVGCGDGSLRLCYVVGEVEPLDRSGDNAHNNAIRALVLAPPILDDAGKEQPRLLYSASEDGEMRVWTLDGPPRSWSTDFSDGPITAMALALGPVAGVERAIGRLWLATATRKVFSQPLDAEGAATDDHETIESAINRYDDELGDDDTAVKVKLAAIAALEYVAEDEARQLLDTAIEDESSTEVRVAALEIAARSQRRASRSTVRDALEADEKEVRLAAFDALVALEEDQPLAALRPALSASEEDVRLRAIDGLADLADESVIAAGLLADALQDDDAGVRDLAFEKLRELGDDPLVAIRIALARGTPDLRARALLEVGFIARDDNDAARAVAAGALDDDDPNVRGAAFLSAVMQRPRLAARLHAEVQPLAQSLDQVARALGVELELPEDDREPLLDDEIEPLFAALACRAPDAAMRGAGSLLALGDPRTIGAILQLTRETDAALRRRATSHLVAALVKWPADERLGARLVWLLDDPDAEVRTFAFDALAKTATASGDAGQLELAELALRCSREDLRVRALQILVRVGAPGSAQHARADALLGDALDDEATRVRSEAFRTVWAWHADDPQVALDRGAASRHGDIRNQVVAELERRRNAKQATPAMDALLLALVKDPVEYVGMAALIALTRQRELPVAGEVAIAAMQSPVPAVRAAGCGAARRAPAADVRPILVKLIAEDHPDVHIAAIEALDAVAPSDGYGFALAFSSLYWDLRVRAAELCAARRDARAIAPMQKLIAVPRTQIDRPSDDIRQRAARAIANVGDHAAFGILRALVDDDDETVREMGARGVALAARPGDEAALVALLGHQDLPVRSWAGEGLAKLGDTRALPVLAGTQSHEHRPLRIGAIVGFVALGADGVRGLRQALEDREREIQELAFAVIVARDAALAAAGIAPDLLVDAMASPSAEIRFAAARLFERRAAGDRLDADAIGELVGPRKPDKVADERGWPPVERRAAILKVLADTIASPEPGRRYAAAQVLAARAQPLVFWREAAALAGPDRGAPAPYAPTPSHEDAPAPRRAGWLRRLVDARATGGKPSGDGADDAARLVFGVYAGLVRQAPRRGNADETHRVRRDAIGRLVELSNVEAVGVEAALPVLAHAISDPHRLVRQAALAAVRSLHPPGALAPLQLAIAAAPDLGRDAIDELVPLAQKGDAQAAALVRGALDADDAEVRAYAAVRLQRLYPQGSTEPQLVAASSRHADVRLAAIAQLATAGAGKEIASGDTRPASSAAEGQRGSIDEALVSALASEHADLRMVAAIALARRGNAAGLDVLAALLRDEDRADEALEALVSLADGSIASAGEAGGAAGAARVIAAKLDDDPDRSDDPEELIGALGKLHHADGAPCLARMTVATAVDREDEFEYIADDAIDALLEIFVDRKARPRTLPDGRTRARYSDALAIATLGEVAKSPHSSIRAQAATALGDVDERGAEPILAKLLDDRDNDVRVAAAEALALRAEYAPGATLDALAAALRAGRRELVLPAALGLAAKQRPEAFQPLMLVAKAAEDDDERDRAIVALGALGDKRALPYLRELLEPPVAADDDEDGDDDADREHVAVAAEALGRLLRVLDGDDAAEVRVKLERLALVGEDDVRMRALTGLRYGGGLAVVEQVARDTDAEEDVRKHAIDELGLAAQPSSEAALAELLGDEDYDIRAHALAALRRALHGDRVRASLVALGSRYETVSEPAARYLATAGDPAQLVERLGAIVDDDARRAIRDGVVRRNALPRAQVDAALRAADPKPRAESAWIAGYAGDAARPLGEAIANAAAASELGWRQSDGGKRGGNARAAQEAEALRASLWAARRAGAASRVDTIGANALADARAPLDIRREAAAVLGAAGSGAALAALGRAVDDADREIRAIAADALARSNAPGAAAAVRAAGAHADATTIAPLALAAWPTIARATLAEPATRAWGVSVAIAGRRVDGAAIAAAKDADEATRLVAIAALGRIGGDAAKRALERLHDDAAEVDKIRLAAWKALKRALHAEAKRYEGDKSSGFNLALAPGRVTMASRDDDDDDDDEDEDEDDEDGDDDDEGGGGSGSGGRSGDAASGGYGVIAGAARRASDEDEDEGEDESESEDEDESSDGEEGGDKAATTESEDGGGDEDEDEDEDDEETSDEDESGEDEAGEDESGEEESGEDESEDEDDDEDDEDDEEDEEDEEDDE